MLPSIGSTQRELYYKFSPPPAVWHSGWGPCIARAVAAPNDVSRAHRGGDSLRAVRPSVPAGAAAPGIASGPIEILRTLKVICLPLP